jgi:divalent metal cation (Fe/Co/Zn/Cd) transporter
VRYRALPEESSELRRTVDRGIASAVLAAMVAINLLFWGPFELAWMWVGSHVEYETHNAFLGIVVAFFGLLATLIAALMVLRQIDHFWILARRAAGYDQRRGRIVSVFAVTSVVGALLFAVWLLLFSGTELVPIGIQL